MEFADDGALAEFVARHGKPYDPAGDRYDPQGMRTVNL